jgi:hypothetical protein
MQFEFDGQKYRIGFHHDPPVEWAAHVNHEVELAHKGVDSGNPDLPAGPVVLVCVACTLAGRGGRNAAGENMDVLISHRRTARRTSCRILRSEGGDWEIIGAGMSVPNLEAGDRFCRETGRQLALKRAVQVITSSGLICSDRCKAFHDEALAAYTNRRRGDHTGYRVGEPAVQS